MNRICRILCGVFILGVLCLVTPVQAQPAVIAGPTVNPANSHAYYLLAPGTWTASEAKAISLGGHLATVRSLAENTWIYNQFSMFNYAGHTARGLWIGLNDATTEGTYVWSSGETTLYMNWGAGEPANEDGLDDYVHLLWPGDPRQSEWNDLQDVASYTKGGADIPVSGVVEVSLRSSNTYAAKFICGVQQDSDITHVPDAQAGRYSTKINVHNNSGLRVNFRKKIIRLRGREEPIDPQAKVFESLKPDQAMEVVCRDIYNHLKTPIPPGTIPPYIEGFVILEVYFLPPDGKPLGPPPADPLDVEGIYTYKGELPKASLGTGVGIEVVVYPAKNNSHILE